MRVGILGSGAVGRALGTAFVEHGHEVTIGSQHTEKDELVAWRRASGPSARTATFAETARQGELLALCCLGEAVDAVIELAGPDHFDGKVLIDVTNPLDFSKGMPPGLFVGLTDSLGERVQRRLPRARVVKCFNIVPNARMGHPERHGEKPDMILAGNDPAAKAQVTEILRSFGWSGAIDIGGIDSARWLEAMVPLWVRVATALGSYDVAFKVVR
ncbi:MAG TPA: NAD(P)-binding domain-containing protein [Thermoplasmata archaeon]|jgi:8-hydroxy-5-deazaflavin:NADPH oxidoreductase|nr:NAD(P)-binding domain-containing protein [Thermoplasmata archaeon]